MREILQQPKEKIGGSESCTLVIHDAEHPTHGDRQVRISFNLNQMKKLQSLNESMFQTMESEKMQKVNGGRMAEVGPTKGVDCCTMTGNGAGQSGSHWDGEDPYTD